METRAPSLGNDTIAAIASPPGSAVRGIVRVSGPRARDLVLATWRGVAPELGTRALVTGRFHDGRGELPVLLVWMPGPRSFTREDVAEFHLPGHAELLQGALDTLLGHGARAAQPGEFTRRAFHSGRIDLTRAEGVLALVHASNEAEARAARALLAGGLEQRVATARETLVEARTLVEAALDFDEHDTGGVPATELAALCERAADALERARDFEDARTDGTGLARIVLCGAPNAGKSSLFNALGGEALVSPHAGTTRDVLEAILDLRGARATLVDTAGLEAADSLGAQERAARERENADLLLWVVDAAGATPAGISNEGARLGDAARVLAWHKSDLVPAGLPVWTSGLGAREVIPVSSRTGEGLLELEVALRRHLPPVGSGMGREAHARHTQALEAAGQELGTARAALQGGTALELVAEHLRRATDHLDAIRGSTTPEDVLDRIFARFCLGK